MLWVRVAATVRVHAWQLQVVYKGNVWTMSICLHGIPGQPSGVVLDDGGGGVGDGSVGDGGDGDGGGWVVVVGG